MIPGFLLHLSGIEDGILVRQVRPMKKQEDESLLTKTAKAIGSAAGKVAAAVGAPVPAESPDPRRSKGKFLKTNKTRLPRKQKKIARKATARKLKTKG
jgi:hypothetical protein